MEGPLRLGIAGLGTVGASVVQVLRRHEKNLSVQAGRAIKLARGEESGA